MPATTPAVPSRDDVFVHGLSRVTGGPLGRHAARPWRRAWTPLRWLLLLTVLTASLGWLQKSPCLTHAWSNEYQYTRLCYSDVYALYWAEGLNNGQVPYRDHPVEYPVVIGGLMWFGSWVAHAWPVNRQGRVFFDVTALLLAACALVVTWTTARLAGRRRIWDAAMVAAAPVLLLHAYTNWDLAAVAFTGAGVYFWSRRRPVPAGVLLGLGVATKLYPLLVLGALLVLCVRARRFREWLTALGAAAAAWLVVDVPVWVAWPSAFGRFYSLNRTRVADWDSIWFAIEHWRGRTLDSNVVPGAAPNVLNTAVGLSLAAALAVVVVIVFVAPRRPRVPQVVFLALVAFMLTNKVASPQYALWLLPFAVLARPRWPAFLAWQSSEVLLLVTRYYFFVGRDKPGQGAPVNVFIDAVVFRDVMLLLLAVLVTVEILRPERDVVRRDGADDPAGGVLDGAADPQPPPEPAATPA